MPYKALERNRALANFTDLKLWCCQQKPAWKIRGILSTIFSQNYTKARDAVLHEAFFFFLRQITTPYHPKHSLVLGAEGLTGLGVWSSI